jgi:hypothetical protein
MSIMRKEFLVVAVILFGSVAPLFAQDAPDGALHGNIGVTYDTKYVWRGITVYGAHSAIHPFIDLDLFGSGFHLEAIGHRANSSGYELGERWDYALYYAGAIEPQQPSETRYMVGYRYFNYPDLSSHTRGSVDLQEMFAGVAFPNLLGVPGLVPGYAVVKGWPSNSDTVVGGENPRGGTYSGWAHIFMLDYALPVQGLTAETPEQVINFHVETVYNDGVDPRPGGGYTDSDWTHVLFGVSTDFNLGNGLTLTPGLNYQVTMEDDGSIGSLAGGGDGYFGKGVSPDHDILWASMTVKYKF